ncbi:C1QT3-like protein [Mya arenaria]|uniref:C1QT3-like protein n=1 Tax=Mya arenaria TaxID=6604 RepID=A0ABY7GDV8_MYAAR|nr:C1QT3-like protein [Mya arenaria]
MLEKMVRTEVKMKELLGKLEALEKRQTNAETEMDTSTKKIQDQVLKHDSEIEMSAKGIEDLEKQYDSLQTECENTTKSYFNRHEKSLELLDQRLDSMSRNCTESMHPSSVAFFATLSSGFTTSSSGQTLVFYNVIKNVGGGYNPGTGEFTAPVDGLYVFSASVMVDLSKSRTAAHISIYKNDSFVVYLYVIDSDGKYETGAGTVILSLQVGDTVKVKCIYSGRIIRRYSLISVSEDTVPSDS